MRNFLTRWYPLIAVLALIALILTVAGCATERDGNTMICAGWCFRTEGHTVIKGEVPKRDEQADAEKK